MWRAPGGDECGAATWAEQLMGRAPGRTAWQWRQSPAHTAQTEREHKHAAANTQEGLLRATAENAGVAGHLRCVEDTPTDTARGGAGMAPRGQPA